MSAPLRISWSRIRAHADCKQKSFLLRTGKKPATTNIRSYFHGMIADRAMRDWLADPDRRPGGMLAMIPALMDTEAQTALDTGDGRVRWKSAGDRHELQEFCEELARRLEPILRDLVLPDPFDNGLRFNVPLVIPHLDGTPTEVILTGELDILVKAPAGLYVWDLKATKDDQYWRKVVGQLVFYDIAMLSLHKERSVLAGLIQPMCIEPVLSFVITDTQRREMWARIIAYATDVWRNEITCKATAAGCDWCEVNHACARFAPAPGPAGNTLSLGLRQAAKDQT